VVSVLTPYSKCRCYSKKVIENERKEWRECELHVSVRKVLRSAVTVKEAHPTPPPT
jgi:hypothetical protein